MQSENFKLENTALAEQLSEIDDLHLEAKLDPIFVIGYKRSGTTLLRLILNTRSEVFIPRESEYFQILPKLYRTKIHKVERIEKILRTLPKDTFENLIDRQYLQALLSSNFPASNNVLLACIYQSCTTTVNRLGARWGDKKPQHWQFIYKLRQWYPQSQYLYVVRDPRDVIASILDNEKKGVFLTQKNILWKFFPEHVIYAWQQRCVFQEVQKQGKILGQARYLRIKYENLATEPLKILKSICEFLGLEPDKASKMLDFHEISQDIHMRDGALDKALNMKETTKALNTNNIGKYAKTLTLEQIQDINFICMNILRDMDYEILGKPGFFRRGYLMFSSVILGFIWKLLRFQRRLSGGL